MRITTYPSHLLFVASLCCIALPAESQVFSKITTGPLVTTAADSRSVNWVDVNNDGYADCMITNGPFGGQNNMLYLNNKTGGFTAVTGSPIVMDGQPSDGATWADADNDGDLDCYVANWYNTKNLYYLNDGLGNFTADTSATIRISGGYCETAAWGDYDRDGLPDLYVINSGGVNKNLLFHNDGSHSFTPITAGSAVNDVFDSRCVNWVDIDGDGDLDLFVTNESGADECMYQNNGGTFVKITSGQIISSGGHTMSSSWADYDNDGDLDVFLANDGSLNKLYRNDGAFSFTLMASDTVSKTMGSSFSSAWSDIDNDGDLDLYVTNSFGSVRHYNFLYGNNGNGGFSRLSNAAPVMDSGWHYGCAFGDYDNDGFEDLAVATCRVGGIDQPDLLYHNSGNSNKWITIKLQGVTSNKSAIGCKVRVKATINGVPVWQLREISAQSGYCSQNDMRAHFGLGNATMIDSIIIQWQSLPALTEVHTQVPVNQFITYTEGQSLGIPQQASSNTLTIYPNPTQGALTIKTEGWNLHPGDKVTIVNAAGTVVHKHQITTTSNTHRLSPHLPAGTYLITVTSGPRNVVQRFVQL